MVRVYIRRARSRLGNDGLLAALRYYLSVRFFVDFIPREYRRLRNLVDSQMERLIDRFYFAEAEDQEYRTEKKTVYIWFIAWGKEYIDAMFNYGLPSVLQAGNVPDLLEKGYKVEAFLYTKESECEYIHGAYSDRIAAAEKHMPFHIVPLSGYEESHRVEVLADAIISMMKQCIADNAMMVVGGADLIYGNHTISNAVRMAEGKNICVAVAHSYVNRAAVGSSKFFNELSRMERTIDNDELVYLAFENAHYNLANAFDDVDDNTTYGGLSLRRGNNGDVYAIKTIPTIILANFTERDLRLFKRVRHFNIWDKRWVRMLCRHNRLKIAGASQMAFFVEQENETERVTPCRPGLLHNDKYSTRANRRLNNYISNSCCVLWSMKKPE